LGYLAAAFLAAIETRPERVEAIAVMAKVFEHAGMCSGYVRCYGLEANAGALGTLLGQVSTVLEQTIAIEVQSDTVARDPVEDLGAAHTINLRHCELSCS
jgi:hypothetical protein